MIKKGVITGCDIKYEWLLKWWWDYYSKNNNHPVAFIDFGMSFSARKWCSTKGIVIPFSVQNLKNKNWIKTTTPYFLKKRDVWYAKIFALLKTPFEYTAWIDLDCEIKKSISPLFTFCDNKTGVAIGRELEVRSEAEHSFQLIPKHAISYNCGVFSFRKNSPLINRWAAKALTHNHDFFADQQLLNTLIHEENFSPFELASIYNQIHPKPNHKDVVIYHHASYSGQLALLEKYQTKNI